MHTWQLPQVNLEGMYQSVFEKAPEGILLTTTDWEIVDVNPTFCQQIGISRQELLGKKLLELGMKWDFHSECPATSYWETSADSITILANWNATSNARIDFLVTCSFPHHQSNLILFYFKKLEAEETVIENLTKAKEVYFSLFENAPIPIWEGDYSDAKKYIDTLRAQGVTDFHLFFEEHPELMQDCLQRCHRIAHNKYARDLFGEESNYLDNPQQWIIEATKKEDRLLGSVGMMLGLIDGEKLHVQEESFENNRGELLHFILESYIPSGFEDSWSEVIVVATEITKLINIQEELRHNQEQLEEQVKERTNELAQEKQRAEDLYLSERKMYQSLQAQIVQRIDFTRALVHELKTPLTPMLVASEILSNSLADPKYRSMAEELYNGAKTLNDRIDELLDVARGEIGMLKLNSQPSDIVAIAKDVSQTSAYLFFSRNQSFTVETPNCLPKVEADPQRIRQVIVNFLDNASKYTPKGGKVTLRVLDHPQEETVEVEDNGLGISEKKQKELFTPYTTLASRGQSTKGIGIGLALCKMLIDLHGGKIWVRDNPHERGCIFGFSLPK